MLEFILNFIKNNLNILVVFAVLVLCLAVYFKFVQKLINIGIGLVALYYVLVVLYKNGVGNTELYEFSKKIIIFICILFENIINSIPNFTIMLNRLYQLVAAMPIDIYIIANKNVGFRVLIKIGIWSIENVINYVNNFKYVIDYKYIVEKLNIKRNISRFSFVIRC